MIQRSCFSIASFRLVFIFFSSECFKLLSGRYTHTSTQTLLFFSMIHDWREIVED